MDYIRREVEMALNRMADMPLKNVQYNVWHHSAGDPNGTPEGINRWHIKGKGWAGAGYHWYIPADGTIYELRPLNKEGVHAGRPANGESWAICLGGNFDKHSPTLAQYESARILHNYLQKRKPGIGNEEHRDHMQTACPGKYFDIKAATAPIKADAKKYYRVITGSFEDKENAERRVRDLDKAGFESFISIKRV